MISTSNPMTAVVPTKDVADRPVLAGNADRRAP
jgi:hypothetical protein